MNYLQQILSTADPGQADLQRELRHLPRTARTAKCHSPDKLTIEGTQVLAHSPEGQDAIMPLDAFLNKITPSRMDTCGVILPDGIKAIISDGPISIWVCQIPPRVYSFRWIKEDSPTHYGSGTQYETVRLALPYLIVLAVFCPDARGQISLSKSNECFFRIASLESVQDELLYPALLNCSKFNPQEGSPLAWICTQHLNRSFDGEPDINKRLRAGFKSLLHCLLETGFNYSSEHHEASSWFTESRGADPRIASVKTWQTASQDTLFTLEVPWLKTGLTLEQVAERIFKNHRARKPVINNSSALARLVFNHHSNSEQPS